MQVVYTGYSFLNFPKATGFSELAIWTGDKIKVTKAILHIEIGDDAGFKGWNEDQPFANDAAKFNALCECGVILKGLSLHR